ncbi:copper chaperone PCu(A)C [Streptomyces sp. NPDC047000]|uniref:copper chaperone PCu(A)C n=1 Tax=Streptomyces sp. NPDC047000 TaxID=3155474 RepID=UPI0033C21CE8
MNDDMPGVPSGQPVDGQLVDGRPGSAWRPSRRRLADALTAAVAPVAAVVLALGGLTAWTAAGKAGGPARITVTAGRVFLPYGGAGAETAAFFDLANTGGSDDRLTGVTVSRGAGDGSGGGDAELSRHRMTGHGTAYRETVASVAVRAGSRVVMSPVGLDVTLTSGASWRTGDLVPFTLYFEHGGAVRSLAVVVAPGDLTP